MTTQAAHPHLDPIGVRRQEEDHRPKVSEGQALRRPTFTVTEAATACSVSRKTITRKLSELATNGAAKDDDGVWRIPVEALLAVGLHPGRSLPPSPGRAPEAKYPTTQRLAAQAAEIRVIPSAPAHQPPPISEESVTISRQRWDDVRIRLARAEAEAAERALALADARLALRALTAAPAPSAQAVTPQGAVPLGPVPNGEAQQPPVRKRRWWHAS